MTEFFAQNFSNFIWLAVIIIAMIPSLENRVAIPFALSLSKFGGQNLPPILALIFAFIGSILPALPVILTFKYMKKKTSVVLHDNKLYSTNFAKKLKQINQKQSPFLKALLICGFVAIPLPLTGVWSGSMLAGISNLKWWQGLISVCAGSLISCIIVLLISLAFSNAILVVLVFSLALAAGILLYELIKLSKK